MGNRQDLEKILSNESKICLCHASWKAILCSDWWSCKQSFKNSGQRNERCLSSCTGSQNSSVPLIKNEFLPMWGTLSKPYSMVCYSCLYKGPADQNCSSAEKLAWLLLVISDYSVSKLLLNVIKSQNKPSFCYHLDWLTFSYRIWALTWNILGLYIGFSLRMSRANKMWKLSEQWITGTARREFQDFLHSLGHST